MDDFLARIYAAVPDMGCKGLCHDTCRDAIPLYGPELERIIARVGPLPLPRERFVCPALGSDGRCGIYDSRPLICRTHGTLDQQKFRDQGLQTWRCPHGCKPDRWLQPDEFLGLFSHFDQLTVRSLDPEVDAEILAARAAGERVFGFSITPDSIVIRVADE